MGSADEGRRRRSGTLRNLSRRAARLLLLVIAVGLIAITGGLFLGDVAQPGPPPLRGTGIPIENTRIADADRCSNFTRASINMIVRTVDRASATADADLGICIPVGALQAQARGGPVPLTARYSVSDVVLASARANLLVTYGGAGTALETKTWNVSLHRVLEAGATHVVILGDITLPLASAPYKYPFDYWFAASPIRVAITGSAFRTALGHRFGSESESILPITVPIALSLFAEPSIGQLWARAGTEAQSATSSSPTTGLTLDLVFFRSTVVRLYVAVVASIPLLLAILLFLNFMVRNTPDSKVGAEALAAIFAALLAVLPIRLVLVPGDLPDLTLVDYWLGFEMALLAAIACLVVRRAM